MKPTNPTDPNKKDANQGEGDRISARKYNKHAENFVADGNVEPAARDAAQFVEESPEEARRAEAAAKRGPKGTKVSVDELVEMGRSVIDRVKPYVSRAVDRIKNKL